MDIRSPMGWLFLAIGAVLMVEDLAEAPVRGLAHLDLAWGALLACFGVALLLLVRRRRAVRRS
jgi:hypothetical protein